VNAPPIIITHSGAPSAAAIVEALAAAAERDKIEQEAEQEAA
jgi:hypothetical protein